MSGGSGRRRGTPGEAARALAGLAAAVALGLPAAAEEPVPPERAQQNLYGITGLIDTPSAEMQPDGQVTYTSSYFDGFLRNTASAQFLPGIETAFRYSILEDMLDGEDKLYDRSFDIKLRLVDEGPGWPAVAVGLQDFLGTGIFSGEYLVATKRFLDGDLKLSGGVGWGRLAGANTVDNPLCNFIDRLCSRNEDIGQGGTVNLGRYFSGRDVNLFGGIEWRTPIEGLSVKAEYSGDDYDREERLSDFERKAPFNVGLEYRVTRGLDVGAYYMYGSAVGLRLSLSGNPFQPLAASDTERAPRPLIERPPPDSGAAERMFGAVETRIGSQPPAVAFAETGIGAVEISTTADGARWATAELPPSADYACPDEAARAIDAEHGMLDAVSFRHPDGTPVCTVALRPAGQRAIRKAVRESADYPTDWYDDPEQRREIVERVAQELGPERVGLFGIELGPERVALYIQNNRFRSLPRAIGRAARVLAAVMPPSVELFEIIPVQGDLPIASVMIRRSALEEHVGRPDATWLSWTAAEVREAPPPDWSEVEGALDRFPRFSWSIHPITPISLFDPDQVVRVDLSLGISGQLRLLPGLSVTASVRKRIIGDLDDIERESDSELPHVRSDVAKYLKQGDPSLSRLSIDYVTKLDEGLYGRLSAGYFESMYGGVGGELLWKPVTQEWGIGADINWVKQRDFDQRFGFRDYEIVTGHANFYWDTGFHGLNVSISAGRYLAGDWGGTFGLTRRFQNGWRIGGFFTLTDVPFEKFGEGSFDKGIFLTIPLNWAAPIETQGSYSTVVRPLTRDGGARLSVPSPLYPIVDDADRGELGTTWGGFWQ